MPQLIGALILFYLAYLFIVYVVLPGLGIFIASGIAVLALVAGVGFISGVFEGLKNFFVVLVDAHKKLP